MALMRKLAGAQQASRRQDDMQSIVDNINNMLSTTRGYGFFLQDFGLSDYRYLSTRDDIAKAIIVEIGEIIELYEPRVVLHRVMDVKDGTLSRLSFQIDFDLRNQPHTLKLFLDPVDQRYRIDA
jgi:predicted component of type VI protein secretion system